jgi:hypothetical protein
MKNLLILLQNKFIRIALIISTLILILILLLSPKRNGGNQNPSELPEGQLGRTELTDLSKEKRNQAMIYVESIESKLPLYLENFPTSVGIETSINLYRLDSDEAEVVRLEIYGLSYLNEDSDEQKNPNVTAFKESYLKALEMLEGQNIDPKRLIFIFGDKEYVRKTSAAWVSALNLHP